MFISVNIRSALDIIVRVAAAIARTRLREIFYSKKLWDFLTANRLIGDIPFSFQAEVSGIKFKMQGPFRFIGGMYYVTYLTQGAYEAAVTTHITNVLRQCHAPRVLDVGANYGWYTIYLAKLLASRGTIFSFEPSETFFPYLKHNVELNNVHNVYLYKLPLSEKRETIQMIAPKHLPRQVMLEMQVINGDITHNSTGALTAIPFDEINKMEAIHPNVVKIDVHGAWKKVIDGMKETLYRDVEHLYLELDTNLQSPHSRNEDIHHVISLLHDVGMDIYEIQNFDHRNGNVIKIDENQVSRRRRTMLYGCKESG